MIDSKRDKINVVLACTVLVVFTFIAYEPVRHNGFITHFDDDLYILSNNHVKSGLTIGNIGWALKAICAYNWHPVTWISHMLDYELYGLNPAGHHFSNVFLHVANAILLFIVLKQMTRCLWCSMFVAVIFAVHPLRVESVAWASERKDVLSSFFWILTMWAYSNYSKKPGLVKYLVVLVLFGVGLMTKQMLVTLPFLLLILDYWPLGRLKLAEDGRGELFSWKAFFVSLRRCVLEKVPLFLMAGYGSLIVYLVQRQSGVMRSQIEHPWDYRIGNVFLAYVAYIKKLFWPCDLAVFYPQTVGSGGFWPILLSALILIIITVLVIWKIRQYPYLFVGWFWYVGTLVPVIGLIQVGMQAYADRYTYMTVNGLVIMIAWSVAEFSRRLPYREIIFSVCSVVLLLVLVAATRHQVQFWRDEVALYKHAIEAVKDNWWAYNMYGAYLKDNGYLSSAKENFHNAIKIRPNHAIAYYNLGSAYYFEGDLPEAIRCWNKTLEINPDYHSVHENLAVAHYRMGHLGQAIQYWTETVKHDRNNQKAFDNL